MYLERQLAKPLAHALASFPAVLVTGPRQAGKTTFVKHELPQATYVSLDDPVASAFAREDPRGFLAAQGEPAVLDEIQHAPFLLAQLKVMIDENRSRKGRFLLTGSQHFALMHGVSESLAGRVAVLDLLPMSFSELAALPPRALAEAVWLGGYPELQLEPRARSLWLGSYLRTYVERDVRALVQVTDLGLFEQFLGLVAAHHGQELNRAKLASHVGVSQPTIKRWLDVLGTSYVVLALSPYFKNFGKRLVKSPKVYFLDSALACHLTRQPSAAAALAGSMGGALMEGWVVSEAYKAYAARGLEPGVYFWRSHDKLEVDLLLAVGTRLLPVEIKKTATPTSLHTQALSGFRALVSDVAFPSGWLICAVETETALAHGHLAVPWHAFTGKLAALLEGGT